MKPTKYILILGFIFLCSNLYSRRYIRHGIIGGSYIYEYHFNKYIQGFEINFMHHNSSCTQSNYIQSFGLNMMYENNFKEIGLSYTSSFFRKISGGKHGGWNLIYKINPNFVTGLDNTFMIKPGIGATIYSGARINRFVLQAFILYNYNIYLQKEQNITGLSNHSIQIGVFIGINAFEINFRNLYHKKESEL